MSLRNYWRNCRWNPINILSNRDRRRTDYWLLKLRRIEDKSNLNSKETK